jgi:hypothetical protein
MLDPISYLEWLIAAIPQAIAAAINAFVAVLGL